MPDPIRCFGLVGCLLTTLSVAGNGQVLIEDRPTCRTCQIHDAATSVHFSDDGDEHAGGAVRQRGRFIVPTRKGGPEVFDQSGRHLFPLSRSGGGPGEFGGNTVLAVGPGDSLAAYDPPNGRIQIFDPNLRFARGFRIGQPVLPGGFLWLSDGRFVLGGPRLTPEGIGYTIHVFGADGVYRKSVGESRRPIGPRSSAYQGFRLLYALSERRIAAVTLVDEYRLQVWNIETGRLERDWLRKSPAFEHAEGPLGSRIVSMTMDSAGRAWVMMSVLAPDWRKWVAEETIGGVEHTFRVLDREGTLDTIVDVIDLEKGELFATGRFPRLLRGFLGGPGLATAWIPGSTLGSDLVELSLQGVQR